jgi:hypothetical protein
VRVSDPPTPGDTASAAALPVSVPRLVAGYTRTHETQSIGLRTFGGGGTKSSCSGSVTRVGTLADAGVVAVSTSRVDDLVVRLDAGVTGLGGGGV